MATFNIIILTIIILSLWCVVFAVASGEPQFRGSQDFRFKRDVCPCWRGNVITGYNWWCC
jgi:hypothetical protein